MEEGSDQQKNVLGQLSTDLDAMFEKMGSEHRRKEIERYQQLLDFTEQIGEKQVALAEAQRNRKSEAPPAVDKTWSSPQSVKQANQQFQRFTQYASKKEGEIDADGTELGELNAAMVAGLEALFCGEKGKRRGSSDVPA